MLQGKESDQFETQRLTHVEVVVSGFGRGKKLSGFVSEVKCFVLKICKKRKEIETEDSNIDGWQKKLKLM